MEIKLLLFFKNLQLDNPYIVKYHESFLENDAFELNVLLGFIQQLPDRYRLVFNLYVLDNYSHKEIAKLLNISEGTSKSNLSRARNKLRIQLEIHQQKEQKA